MHFARKKKWKKIISAPRIFPQGIYTVLNLLLNKWSWSFDINLTCLLFEVNNVLIQIKLN